jgi:hypothetical protein
MRNWFLCKIKYEKNVGDGKIANITETYLVDALSFTEAEARIIEEMKPYISGEFTVENVSRSRIYELFPNEHGDRWYRCKVSFISLDEEKGVEKRTKATILVQASDVNEAWEELHKGMQGTMADYEVNAIIETDIMDIYPYSEKQ